MRIFTIGAMLALGGCATTSFAPPRVNMKKELQANETQTFFGANCTPDPRNKQHRIDRDVNGALLLISNYILTYRCQADRAAEGRQFFEVPAFLSIAGAATATALGAGPIVAIGAGAASAVLDHSKSYYAPKDKAVVLNDGLDALLCIQNEAVGVDAFTLQAIGAVQTGGKAPANVEAKSGDDDVGNDADTAGVYISVERRYHEMIRSALISVERVVARRLSSAGTPFYTGGVLAEMQAFQAEIKEEEKKSEAPSTDAESLMTAAAPVTVQGVGSDAYLESSVRLQSFREAKKKLTIAGSDQVGKTLIKVRTLQPKLNQCILRAKI